MNKLLLFCCCSILCILSGSPRGAAEQSPAGPTPASGNAQADKEKAPGSVTSSHPSRPNRRTPRASENEREGGPPKVEIEEQVSGPSLDDTLTWLRDNIDAPFNISAKADAHVNEAVFYSTEVVDWNGCTVHFRSERDHTVNGDTTKRTVEETIPLEDVDPSRIEPYPLYVPGLLWAVPSISVSTSYRKHTILDTWQSPDQDTFYTNLIFSDPSGEKVDRIVGALQYAVDVCGGQPEIF